jgi:LEA14-like dessication related protein
MKSFSKLLTKLMCVLGLLMLSACSTLKFETPKLSVINVGMVSADVFSQQFKIRLHVRNPNDRELPIRAIEYKLFLQGDSFAEGFSNEPFVVPALGEAEFDTVVRTNFMSSVGRLLSKMNTSDQGKVQYGFTGTVILSKGMLKKLPFSEQGMVDLAIKK